MNEKPSDVALPTVDPVVPAPSGFGEKAKSAYASAKDSAGRAAHAAAAMGRSAGDMMASAATSTGKRIGEAAVLVGDLNNDGKVDHEDARIAVAKAKDLASKTADEAGAFAKEVAKNDMFKDAAAGAAIGARVALPLTHVGSAGGASIGAVAGAVKNIVSPSNKK